MAEKWPLDKLARGNSMKHVAADAIKVDGGWIVDIPGSRLRVCVASLADVDERVGCLLGRLNGSGRRVHLTVDIIRFLHLDDCSPARRRRVLGYGAAEEDPGRRHDAVPT